MDYLKDIGLDEYGDIRFNDAHDIDLVTGEENLQQSIEIAAKNAVRDFVGRPLDGESVGVLEGRLQRILDSDPQVGTVVDVEVVEYDRRSESVVIEAHLMKNDNFEVELNA